MYCKNKTPTHSLSAFNMCGVKVKIRHQFFCSGILKIASSLGILNGQITPESQLSCSRIGRIERVDLRSTIDSTGCVWIPSLSSVGSFLFVFVLFLWAFETRE